MGPIAKVIGAKREGYGRKGGEKPGVGIILLLMKGAEGTQGLSSHPTDGALHTMCPTDNIHRGTSENSLLPPGFERGPSWCEAITIATTQDLHYYN